MIRRSISLPELALIAGARAALGAGIGLLLADKICPEKRSAVGWTLLSVGVLSTFPLVAQFMFGNSPAPRPTQSPACQPDLEPASAET